MNTTKKLARTAGFWYLMMAITGFAAWTLLAAPLETGDAAATAHNLLESEGLFRLGIVTYLLCQVAFVWLVLALYRLFQDVNRQHARLMVALVLVSIPVAFLNMLNPVAALLVLKETDVLASFSLEQRQSMAMLFLKLQDGGTMIAQIFWGLWLFPFGWLTYKSGFLPRVLGVLLIVAGVCYVLQSAVYFFFPDSADTVDSFASLPEGIGELSTVVWLLVKGARERDHAYRQPALAAS